MSLGYFQSIKKPKKCQRRYSTETFKTFPNVGNTDIDTYSKLDHEGVYNAADHSDEVEGVPVVFEVALEEKQDETCLSKYVHVHLELSRALQIVWQPWSADKDKAKQKSARWHCISSKAKLKMKTKIKRKRRCEAWN